MVEFRLFGIQVTVQPMFWLTMGLLGFLFTGADSLGSNAFLAVGLFVIVGFVSILVHELGHALIGRKLGGGNPQIVLHNFGGFAAFPWALPRWRHILMVAAGPGAQLLLAFVVLFLTTRLPSTTPEMIRMMLYWLVSISIFWPIFNLLPILPMDGGQIMSGLLGAPKRKLAHQISMIVAGGITILSLMGGLYIIAIFIGYMAYENWRELR